MWTQIQICLMESGILPSHPSGDILIRVSWSSFGVASDRPQDFRTCLQGARNLRRRPFPCILFRSWELYPRIQVFRQSQPVSRNHSSPLQPVLLLYVSAGLVYDRPDTNSSHNMLLQAELHRPTWIPWS